MPFRINAIAAIVGRYSYPFLMFIDRVDFRRRWENVSWNTRSDSNHGKQNLIRGGNAAYSDGHVSWRNYQYFYTGAMWCPSGWQISHNDGWDGFVIPTDCTAWIKNGNRTRFFYGMNQASGVQWYNPLQ